MQVIAARLLPSLRRARGLRREESGLALTEFAIGFPIILMLGLYAIDMANLALTHMRVSQIALNLADNASRVGSSSSLSTQQLREIDIEDVFQAAKTHGSGIKLETKGRVILSSLEKDNSGNQRIHWQRCFGRKTGDAFESHYGKAANTAGNAPANLGTTATAGMGPTGAKVHAPANNSGVMFVEVNYERTPMFPFLVSPSTIGYVASFIVRDPRDFSQIYISEGVTASTCGYAADPPKP
jgi:Flp pilus assembly protein TadG